MNRKQHLGALLALLVIALAPINGIQAAPPADRVAKIALEQNPSLSYAPSRVLVRFKPDAPPGLVENARGLLGTSARHTFRLVPGLERLDIGMEVPQAVAYLRGLPFVDYAEPDYVVQAVTVPNDVSFGEEWGLDNTGQTIGTSTGTPDADIDMPEAWDITTGSGSSIIAVIDTGTQWDHPDLAANIWSNPGEIPGNGIDDDGNGYVDDVRGWDFYDNDNDPTDAKGHGTHTAGTICAIGNNGEGVAGVLWNCRIMPLRFIGPNGGYTSDAVRALNYAVANGARVSSNSWGSYGFSISLYNAVYNAAASGHIFVAAAGNDGYDNDTTPFYPASFNTDNVISVAATNNRDNKASWSNYGLSSVDVGAPGVKIYSTYKGSDYRYLSGTSMATPHVAGLVALLQEQHASWDYQQVIARILDTVRPLSALQGKTVSGGIINAQAALGAAGGSEPLPPPPATNEDPPVAPENLTASADTTGVVTLAWDDMSDNEKGFEMEREKKRRNNWVSSTMINTVSADVTQATDSPGDGTFHYRIRAYNDFGTSAWTDWVSVDVTTSGGGGGGGGKPCHGKKCSN